MKSAGSRCLESPAGRRRRPAAPCRSNRKRWFLPRARGLEPGDDLAQFRVHVAARHRAGGERMVQVADHGALLGEIGHHLAGREQSRIELLPRVELPSLPQPVITVTADGKTNPPQTDTILLLSVERMQPYRRSDQAEGEAGERNDESRHEYARQEY